MAEKAFVVISKVLGYQVLIITLTTLFVAIILGGAKACSSALGGLAAFLPNLYFGIRVYKSAGQPSKKILNSFYIGEAGKLLFTGLLFLMIFQLPNIEIVPVLIGYILALSVFWFALLMR